MTVGDSAKAKLVWTYPDGSTLELDLDKVDVKGDKKGVIHGEFSTSKSVKARNLTVNKVR
jgi:hypothetical protein